MGGCGSTNFISWFSRRIDCNCPYNSEGLPKPGPGANPLGLKHRMSPPTPDDPVLQEGKRIEKALFLFDSPYDIIPSLFRRKIAVGHAIAITGTRPDHDNDLDKFLDAGVDSFGLMEQFSNWASLQNAPYPRLLVRSSDIWSQLPFLFNFLDIDANYMPSFPGRKERQSSFCAMSKSRQLKLIEIYQQLNQLIVELGILKLICK